MSEAACFHKAMAPSHLVRAQAEVVRTRDAAACALAHQSAAAEHNIWLLACLDQSQVRCGVATNNREHMYTSRTAARLQHLLQGL
jgi:hypothetical protein